MKVLHSASYSVCSYHVKSNKNLKFKMSKSFYDNFELAFIEVAKEYGCGESRKQLEGYEGCTQKLLIT